MHVCISTFMHKCLYQNLHLTHLLYTTASSCSFFRNLYLLLRLCCYCSSSFNRKKKVTKIQKKEFCDFLIFSCKLEHVVTNTCRFVWMCVFSLYIYTMLPLNVSLFCFCVSVLVFFSSISFFFFGWRWNQMNKFSAYVFVWTRMYICMYLCLYIFLLYLLMSLLFLLFKF